MSNVEVSSVQNAFNLAQKVSKGDFPLEKVNDTVEIAAKRLGIKFVPVIESSSIIIPDPKDERTKELRSLAEVMHDEIKLLYR